MAASGGVWAAAVVTAIRRRLTAVADPARALQQAKYMRNQFAFLGVSNPQCQAAVTATLAEVGVPWETHKESASASRGGTSLRVVTVGGKQRVVGEEETAAVLRALWEQVWCPVARCTHLSQFCGIPLCKCASRLTR